MTTEIDTGDHVHHGPTDEDWVVARVQDDKLAWCGWPPGWADLADCTLTKKATPEERELMLATLAQGKGMHADWANNRLAQEYSHDE